MAEKAPQLTDEFRDFFVEAKQHGYGSRGVRKMSTPSGGTEVVYQRDNWMYTDIWEGGDPFLGSEHVSYKRQNGVQSWLPIWGMNYVGEVLDSSFATRITQALANILSSPEYELPIRGPFKSQWDDVTYSLEYVGNLEDFTADEFFCREGSTLYVASFAGKLINRRLWENFADKLWVTDEQ